MYIKLFRAMSDAEFTTLTERCFNSTFRAGGYKFFTRDKEYLYIIFNEPNYNKCPEYRYHHAIGFNITFRFRDIPKHLIRVFNERGYTTYMINSGALAFIDNVEWEELPISSLPQPEPVLTWKSRKDKIISVYSTKKAKTILDVLNRDRVLVNRIEG